MKGSTVVSGFARSGSAWTKGGWTSNLCHSCYPSSAIDPSYPAELPEMAARGWPALISGFKAFDRSGKSLELASPDKRGWKLPRSCEGRVTLAYDVDFGLFAAKGWSSPLESAFVDAEHISVSGRGLFIVTDQIASIEVDFDVRRPSPTVMPWMPRTSAVRARRTVTSIVGSLMADG